MNSCFGGLRNFRLGSWVGFGWVDSSWVGDVGEGERGWMEGGFERGHEPSWIRDLGWGCSSSP